MLMRSSRFHHLLAGMVAFVVVLTALVGLIAIALGLPIGILGVVGIGLIIYAVVSYYVATSVVRELCGSYTFRLPRRRSITKTRPSFAIDNAMPSSSSP
mgnify:CR=1 FL=1